ncbi:hypothetical protein [Glycomyces sp. NPDC047010]|uniref:hypothetical protein n=1 Tax=Glycomyces sp. NPDC047010 TaxID=3155023 RepID=UPI0033C30D6F
MPETPNPSTPPSRGALATEGWSVTLGEAHARKPGRYDVAMALAHHSDGRRGWWSFTARITIRDPDDEGGRRIEWDQDFPDRDARDALDLLWTFMDSTVKVDPWDLFNRPTFVDMDRFCADRGIAQSGRDGSV